MFKIGEDTNGFLQDYFNKLVGVPRLRQKRVISMNVKSLFYIFKINKM